MRGSIMQALPYKHQHLEARLLATSTINEFRNRNYQYFNGNF